MIQHCVFDLGGVLFRDGTQALRRRLVPAQEGLVDAILRSPESRALRSGTMDEDAFWAWADARIPTEPGPITTAAALREAWYESYTLDAELMALLEELHRGGASLVVFSGNVRSRVEYLDRKYDFRRLFVREVYSYDHGCTKPDPRFVDALLTELGCPPEHIVYVDDKDSALAPAAARGIRGVRYEPGGIAPLRAALREAGVDALA